MNWYITAMSLPIVYVNNDIIIDDLLDKNFELIYIVHPSSKHSGMIQLSEFVVQDGSIHSGGDTQHQSMFEIEQEMTEKGYKRLSQDETMNLNTSILHNRHKVIASLIW